jgi:predicted FMN-binding regulatory protein PaiB
MYIPEAHREHRQEQIHAIIQQNSFGTLVTCQEGEQRRSPRHAPRPHGARK